MAAPEEPELSQAQTEKLLQFQVDSPNVIQSGSQFVTHLSDLLAPVHTTCSYVGMFVHKGCLPVNFDNAAPLAVNLSRS